MAATALDAQVPTAVQYLGIMRGNSYAADSTAVLSAPAGFVRVTAAAFSGTVLTGTVTFGLDGYFAGAYEIGSTYENDFTANPGTYTLTVHYSGDQNYAPADLPPTTVTIPAGADPNAPTLSVAAGRPAVVNDGSALLSSFAVDVNDPTAGPYFDTVNVNLSAINASDPAVRIPLQTSSSTLTVSSPGTSVPFTLDAPTTGLTPGSYQLVYDVTDGTSYTTVFSESYVTVGPTTTSTATLPAVDQLAGATTPVVAGVPQRVSAIVDVPSSNGGAGTVNVYASKTGSIDSASTLLGSARKRVAVPRGATTAAVTVPLRTAAAPAGAYVLLARVTGPTGTATDAAVGPVFTVLPPVVYLRSTITRVVPTTTLRVGSAFAFTLTLTNTGNVATTGRATVAVSLSENLSTPTVPVRTLTPALKVRPGKPVVLRLSGRVPTVAAAAAAANGGYLTLVVHVLQDGAMTVAASDTGYNVTGR